MVFKSPLGHVFRGMATCAQWFVTLILNKTAQLFVPKVLGLPRRMEILSAAGRQSVRGGDRRETNLTDRCKKGPTAKESAILF